MKAYSDDLRERVWRACHDEAMGPSEAAEELGVSRSFVCKLMRRFRDEGTLSAKPRGGNRPPALGAADLAALRRLVRERPDATRRWRSCAGYCGSAAAWTSAPGPSAGR